MIRTIKEILTDVKKDFIQVLSKVSSKKTSQKSDYQPLSELFRDL